MAITNGYCTLENLKRALSIPVNDVQEDEAMEAAIEAASRGIDDHCGRGRKFWQDATAVARFYYPKDSNLLRVFDIATTTDLAVAVDQDDNGSYETTLTITSDFLLEPMNAAAEYPVRPYTMIRLLPTSLLSWPLSSYGRPTIRVTAKYGWSAVPRQIERACIIQARSIYKAPAGASYQIAVDGSPMRMPAIDPAARQLLEGFIRYEEVDDAID